MTKIEQDAAHGTSDSIHGAQFTSASPIKLAEVEKVLTMGKGYSKSTSVHGMLRERGLPDLDQALEHVSLPSHGPVVVVELGCSSGPNAICSMVHVVKKLRERVSQSGSSSTEFQAFFNDLPSNDFNNLFQLLSSGGKGTLDFVGGIPGSFFGRLFPRSSVHVFASSMSVHWLSKIPDAILDKNDPAFNEGRVWLRGASLEVDAAFKQQAVSDLKKFLSARAAELVSGGLLFFDVIGRYSGTKPQRIVDVDDPVEAVWESLDEVWDELISQGVLTVEQRDTFNIPNYYPSLDEVMEAVDSCGSNFHVQTARYVKLDSSYADIYSTTKPAMFAKKKFNLYKSLWGSVLEAHIGKDASETFWSHVEPKHEKKAVDKLALHPNCSLVFPLIILIRK